MESNSYENPDNEVFKYGKAVFDEFVISNMSDSIQMNIFQAWAGSAKLSDITPPSYPHLWQITRSVQKQREASGPGPGDFIDRLNELTKKVKNGEFPSLDSDQVTGQVELNSYVVNLLKYFTRALLLLLLDLRQPPTL